jgi:Zn-dependent protease with chaperone function
MWEFKVLLFAPGHKPSGVRARVSFHGDAMSVRGARLLMSVECRHVTVKAGGYDGRQWLLSWPGDGGEVNALLTGETEMRLMRQYAPPALADQLKYAIRVSHRRKRRFLWMMALLILAVLLPLLLLGLFWLNSDRVAGWVSQHISQRTESRLGELAFRQMSAQLQLVETGPAPDMVRQIGARLTRGSAYDYQWFVAASPEVNAFAMPGGYVVVYTGLLQAARNAEEVAGVLAHEVQHVEARHSLKNLIHGLGWRALLSVTLGDLSGGVWMNLADQLGSLKYSRDLEREADLKGLEALRRAGIAPGGMASFFAGLANREDQPPPLLSSHPTSRERQAALEQAAAALGDYPTQPLPYYRIAIRASLPQGPE